MVVGNSNEDEIRLYGYVVDINSYCTHSERSQEEYGPWSEAYDNTFIRIRRKRDEEYSSVSSSLDLPAGTPVFVVWVEYDEGDSFGNANRRGKEVIAIFTDKTSVKEAVDYLWSNSGPSHLDFKTSDGQHHKLYVGFGGYFDTLREVNVEDTIIQF